MVWLQFCETIHKKYQHETETADEQNETQIQSLPAGGAHSVSLVSAVNKAVYEFNVHYTEAKWKEKKIPSKLL